MNEQDYASLEASKRLVEAGIVLETDFWWTKECPYDEWSISTNGFSNSIPAPSMAEVWRELPVGRTLYTLFDGDEHFFWYTNSGGAEAVFYNTNPTDSLINLLIYIKSLDSRL